MNSIRRLIWFIPIAFVLSLPLFTVASPAFAQSETYQGSVTFVSDLEAAKTIDLTAFDTLGGTRTLTSVTVEVFHRGSIDIAVDNDDNLQGGTANGRMIRMGALGDSVTGPGVASGWLFNTVTTGQVVLDADDGDNGVFDSSPPDGTDFGGPLSYSDILAGPYTPDPDLYDDGPGLVTFSVGAPFQMVNDVQWVSPPDQWQMEVQNPAFIFTVRVTYEYDEQEEPDGGAATGVPVFPTMYIGIAAALGAGVLAYLIRRRLAKS